MAAVNPYPADANLTGGPDGPAFTMPYTHAIAVTPSDSATLVNATRALWIGGTGTLTVVMSDGTTVEFQGVPSGYLLPIICTQVKNTGTSASLIVALS